MNAYSPFTPSDLVQSSPVRQREQTIVCRRVRDETRDVRSFVFAAKSGHPFSFKPGQFVTLHLWIGGSPVIRTYSVSSPPTRPHEIEITVKRVPGGRVSNWLHDTLSPGDEIEIEGPAGAFNFDDLPSEKPLFLSGGSGITPVMSMLRALIDSGSNRHIRFVHSARTPAEIIFRPELDALAARFSNIDVTCVCSQEVPAWHGPTGRIDGPMLQRLVPDLRERTAYVCGPEPYMQAMRGCLEALGITRYHEESFGGGAAVPSTAVSAAIGRSSVRFHRSGAERDCAPGETLLDAARNCGVYIPTACQQGICGTCRTLKLSGEVAMDDLGGLSDEEKAAGYVLACCSHPQGTVLLDV